MAKESVWKQLFKPQFVERDTEIETLFGVPADRAGSFVSGAALISAFMVIPAVFMAASKYSNLKTFGVWAGYVIWAIFLMETLIFIRLEKGWGATWLKKHWLQIVVIFLASPFTAIVLENAIMPMVAVLLSVQSFVNVSLLFKLFTGLKLIKLLHLEEVRQKIKKSAKRVKWLYRTSLTSITLCGLGILGSSASGGAPTPLHGLKMWWLLLDQAISVAPELFIVSLPVVVIIGGFAVIQYRWSIRSKQN